MTGGGLGGGDGGGGGSGGGLGGGGLACVKKKYWSCPSLVASVQGLTLVHFLAQRKRFV
jgi:hypothetical protein